MREATEVQALRARKTVQVHVFAGRARGLPRRR